MKMQRVLGVTFVVVAGFFGGLALSVPGCGGDSPCVGAESCACTTGGACDPGLTCLSKRCVKGAASTGDASASATDVPAAVTTTPAQACDDLTKICDRLNTCAPLAIKVAYGDLATCVARTRLDCLDAIAAPNTGLTGPAVTTCLNAATAASCSDLIYRKVAACQFKGTRANGVRCGTNEQCVSGYCGKSDSNCGTCAAHAGAGAKCAQDDDCEPGFDCSDDLHCVLPGPGGTGCSATQPCAIGFYCRNGSCAATAGSAGAACQDLFGCDFFQGLFCNTTLRVCQKIKYPGPGEACGLVNSEFLVCSPGANCITVAGAVQGVCAMVAADGATCGATNNLTCTVPAQCFSGRCTLPNSSACN